MAFAKNVLVCILAHTDEGHTAERFYFPEQVYVAVPISDLATIKSL
jgi:hypothetical protein